MIDNAQVVVQALVLIYYRVDTVLHDTDVKYHSINLRMCQHRLLRMSAVDQHCRDWLEYCTVSSDLKCLLETIWSRNPRTRSKTATCYYDYYVVLVQIMILLELDFIDDTASTCSSKCHLYSSTWIK